jgi:uncharacterized protein YndB with AHSA1/START domain
MIDIVGELSAIHRETGEAKTPNGAGRTVVLRRDYQASVDDVWDAITNPDRINRWFVPVSGDLRLGGRYQIEGNAGGEILRCEPPRLLALSWIYGEPKEGDFSEVTVRLDADGPDRTTLELEHVAIVEADRWTEFGPGAVGVGWDLTLLGLSLHLQGGSIEDPRAWEVSAEARDFMTRSSAAWREAHEASGATPEEAANAAANTKQFYAPDPA